MIAWGGWLAVRSHHDYDRIRKYLAGIALDGVD
jgi:hypothetical protein